MKLNKLLQKAGLILLVLLVLMTGVSAFGVTAPYWNGNPLVLTPGDVRDVTLTLQNMVGDEDLSISMEVLENKQYVVHKDATMVYSVPAKTKGVKVNFEIRVPEDAGIGTELPVDIYFVTASEAGSGQLALGTGISKKFIVRVGGEAKPEVEKPIIKTPKEKPEIQVLTPNKMLAALGIVMLVFILWLFLRRSKRKKSNKKGAVHSKQNEYAQW